MNRRKKKIKLDPDIVKKEPQQEEEAEETDGMYSFEEVLVETSDEIIELEPEHFFIKHEIDEEQVEVEEDTEEIDENQYEISVGNLSPHTEDETESEFKSDKRNRPTKTVRDFICTTCNYTTNKPIDFISHWLSHEGQSYMNTNGVDVCQISGCYYVAPIKGDILKHIASRHLRRYRCDFCYYVTYSKKDYDQHRTTHYTYQCIKCDLQSTKLFFVQDHIEDPLKCKMCDFTAHHWCLYEKHIIWHQYPPDSIVECGFCDFATGDEALLEKHKAVHCIKLMLCKMCSWTGMNIVELAKHCKTAHDTTLEAVDKLHKCKYCTCKFVGLGSKEKHEELHLKNGASLKCCLNFTKVQCPYCDNRDSQRDSLNLHILSTHTPALELEGFRFENTSDEIVLEDLVVLKDIEASDVDIDECKEIETEQEANTEDTSKKEEEILISEDTEIDQQASKTRQIIWRCPICSNLSNGKHDFNRHLITLHNMSYTEAKKNSRLRFCCAFCPFTSTDRSLFDKHLTVHHTPKHRITPTEQGQPRYICSFCYYVTSSKEDYDGHYKTHTTFKCTKCQFESNKRLFVEDHIENPWGCSKCNFKAHHWLPMKSHSFSHHNQASTLLKCNECDFETRRPGVLRTHWLTHTTVVLRCNICMFKTRCEYTLKTHYAERHDGISPDDETIPSDERPYRCDLCACKFKQQVYLDKHRTLHGENGPFRLKCSQCHKSKKYGPSDKDEEETKKKESENAESWTECPYCSYEDKVRYRMIEHLSQIHQKELEIEGFRFDDGQTEEKVPHTATSIGNPAAEVRSNTEVPQIHGTLPTTCPDNTAESEETICTEQNEDKEIGMHTRDVPECTSDTKQTKNINKQKTSRIDTRQCPGCNFSSDKGPLYNRRCDICSYITKRKHVIQEHIDKNDPPLPREESADDANEKRKHLIQKNMFTEHTTKDQAGGDMVIFKHGNETQSEDDTYQNKSMEEGYIHKPFEQIEIKVEASFREEENVTSKDNTVCSNSVNMQHQYKEPTRIRLKPVLTTKLVPKYGGTENRWCCPVCPYIVLKKHFVEQHIEQKHKGGQNITWYCKICPYRAKLEGSLQQHMALLHQTEYRRNAESEEIPCKQPGCDFKAATVDDLSMHMARHLQSSMQEMMVYKCKHCSFGTVSKTIFKTHTKSCNDKTWYYCHDCDFKTEKKKGIWFHIDRKHRYKYKYKTGYECKKCGYSSKERSWREYHHVYCRNRVKY